MSEITNYRVWFAFFVKKLGDTGWGFDFQGVRDSKLQGVVRVFLKKIVSYRVWFALSGCPR